MASEEIRARIGKLPVAALKLACSRLGQSARNGKEAIEFLADVPDALLIETLRECGVTVAQMVTANAQANEDTEASDAESGDVERDPFDGARFVTPKRIEVSYNGKAYVFAPSIDDCDPMPAHVARHYQAWLTKNNVRFDVV